MKNNFYVFCFCFSILLNFAREMLFTENQSKKFCHALVWIYLLVLVVQSYNFTLPASNPDQESQTIVRETLLENSQPQYLTTSVEITFTQLSQPGHLLFHFFFKKVNIVNKSYFLSANQKSVQYLPYKSIAVFLNIFRI